MRVGRLPTGSALSQTLEAEAGISERDTTWVPLDKLLSERVVTVSRTQFENISESAAGHNKAPVFNISPELMYQMDTNPVDNFVDLEDEDAHPPKVIASLNPDKSSTEQAIETMVTLSGQKVL